jgi:outer membrane protein insertion porin family
MKLLKIFITSILINLSIFLSLSFSEIVKKIEISGNDRISEKTILIFSEIEIGDEIEITDTNILLKNLYDTNFFKNVSVNFKNNVLKINVEEAPLIENININGLKANKYKELVRKKFSLKPRSSYNEIILIQDVKSIESLLKSMGFYFAKVEPSLELLDKNLLNINYNIDLGEKAKIAKITFVGDKIFKDRKLKSIIISEEYKFWKFISGKKYLQEQIIDFDKRLLKNFYLNKGYYNMKINSSFAKSTNNEEFELIYNIKPNQKIFFGELKISLPNDFDKKNYLSLNNLFEEIKGEPYSLNRVEQILSEVDQITLDEEYKTVRASVEEKIIENNLNINFIIDETEKFFVEKINIFGNTVTRESVIRNQLELDEGDPYSEILLKKSENNIKSLNFFKDVNLNITDGKDVNTKIINFRVDEKPTGEIVAGAGAGTGGSSLFFGVKENNYLGKGLAIDANATISSDSFKGLLSVSNPNYNNSDKSVFFNVQSLETDKLKNFGYKTTKNGFEIGTSYEFYDDFYLGISTSTFAEKIKTDSTASARQQSQAGNYLDTFLKANFDLDKRNQKFKTSDGFRSFYSVDLPLISDTNTLTNTYSYRIYKELFDENISSLSIVLKGASSISGDNIKLSERLTIPYSRLRGFESGKVGPKDGADFVGGNYLATINLQSNIPFLFENSQNLDTVFFFDAANIWGVDYDSSIDDSNKIRSSVGIGIDWLTAVGPLNFSLSEVITKNDTDVEETFRFNLGTTF